MKKLKLFLILLCLGVFLPKFVYAAEYKTMNLEEALTQEKIEHNLSSYKESNDQAIIYLFRGNGCGFCQRFLTFLNSIVPEYGKYFRLVSYEVWNDKDNAELMEDVADYLGESVGGVPFIVIGDTVFGGYASSYDDNIKKAIMEQYESKNSYDVMEKLKNKENESETKTSSTTNSSIILWTFLFVAISTGILAFMQYNNTKVLEEKIASIHSELMKKQSNNSKLKK